MTSQPLGILVMAYGTPASPSDIEAYYTHIRRGRAPSPDQLADLMRRYESIGGVSPMRERTEAQTAAIASEAAALTQNRVVTALGQKHAAPFVEDGVERLIAEGAGRITGLVLAPHYSAGSVGQYHERARRAAADKVPYDAIDDWSDLADFVDFTADTLRETLVGMPESTRVYFTAHSLPLRVLADDPYESRLRSSAQAIAEAAGLAPDRWAMAWQSAGRTPEPWAGPDILEVIAAAGEDPDIDGLVVVPQGFTSDHLEILYDLDIEAHAAAQRAGLAFARTASINDDRAVMAALARVATGAVS